MAKEKTIYRSSVVILALLLLSKLLGFVRLAAVAGVFGSSASTDLYFIPSEFIINITGSTTTAFTAALVTLYVSTRENQGRQAARNLVSGAMSFSLSLMLAVTLVLVLLAEPVSRLLAPGYDGEELARLAFYLRTLAPILLLTTAQANYTAVLNAEERFAPGKLYGILMNVLTVAAVLLLGRSLGIQIQTYSTYAAQLLFLLILVVCARRYYRLRFGAIRRDPAMAGLIRLTLPVFASSCIMQLSVVLGKAVCSYLGTGVASSYSYAYSLEQLVTGSFATMLTTVFLPRFSALASRGEKEELQATASNTVAMVFQLLGFVAIVTLFFGRDIVSVVYMRGAFTQENVVITALVLSGFALGFPMVSCRELLRMLHIAYGKVLRSTVIDVASFLFCAVSTVVLRKVLGVFGIALAFSLAGVLSVTLLGISLHKGMGVNCFALSAVDWLKTVLILAASALGCLPAFFYGGGAFVRLLMGAGCAGAVFLIAVVTMRPAGLADLLPKKK